MYALFQFFLPLVMIITHNHVIITTQGTNMHDISKEFVMMDEMVEITRSRVHREIKVHVRNQHTVI
jgi:hypothetical protein